MTVEATGPTGAVVTFSAPPSTTRRPDHPGLRPGLGQHLRPGPDARHLQRHRPGAQHRLRDLHRHRRRHDGPGDHRARDISVAARAPRAPTSTSARPRPTSSTAPSPRAATRASGTSSRSAPRPSPAAPPTPPEQGSQTSPSPSPPTSTRRPGRHRAGRHDRRGHRLRRRGRHLQRDRPRQLDGASSRLRPGLGHTFALGPTPVTCSATDQAAQHRLRDLHRHRRRHDGRRDHRARDITSRPGPLGRPRRPSARPRPTSSTAPSPRAATPPPGPSSVGTTTVNCSATDAAGNSRQPDFTVTVTAYVDTSTRSSPCPADMTVEATGPAGAVVTFSASALDNSTARSPRPAARLGHTFALGPTTVTCSATDQAAQHRLRDLHRHRRRHDGPAITVPGDITVAAEGPSGAHVDLQRERGRPRRRPPRRRAATPPPGPLPDRHHDRHLQRHRRRRQQRQPELHGHRHGYVDHVDPVVTVPADMTVEATGPAGAVVTFSAPPSTTRRRLVPACGPASGNTFALGPTLVTCSATDQAAQHRLRDLHRHRRRHDGPGDHRARRHQRRGRGPLGRPRRPSARARPTSSTAPSPRPATAPPGASSRSAPRPSTAAPPTPPQPAGGQTSRSPSRLRRRRRPGRHRAGRHDRRGHRPRRRGRHLQRRPPSTTSTASSVRPAARPRAHLRPGPDARHLQRHRPGRSTPAPRPSPSPSSTRRPPAITVPDRHQRRGRGPRAPTSTFSATAADLVDGPLAPTCDAASGNLFPIGTTTVTCSATDAAATPAATTSRSPSRRYVDTSTRSSPCRPT